MRPKKAPNCEFLSGTEHCNAISGEVGQTLRNEECNNPVKDTCCYTCIQQEACDISCDHHQKQQIKASPFDRTKSQNATKKMHKPFNCRNCGTLNAAGSRFCKKCGCNFGISESCPQCGNKLDSDSIFCQQCGFAIRDEGVAQLSNRPSERRRNNHSGSKRGRGIAELLLGSIFILVFFATLTISTIPIVWTGAMLTGVVFVLYGLYHLIRG